MHTLGKVDAVENLDFVPPPLQESAHLGKYPTLGIYHHIGRMGLQELGREPEAGFARAGRADDTGVEVAGIGRIFGPCVDGELFRPGENDIVFKLGIDKGLDVLFRPP